MPQPQSGTSSTGEPMHYTVGAVIERDGEYLLIDRVNPPFGFAAPAGHIDEGESDPAAALKREVKEETELDVVGEPELLFEEEVPDNMCTRGVSTHHWRVYRCKAVGEIPTVTEEAKSIGWYTKEELATLELEPVWQHWFGKMGLL